MERDKERNKTCFLSSRRAEAQNMLGSDRCMWEVPLEQRPSFGGDGQEQAMLRRWKAFKASKKEACLWAPQAF